MLCYRDMTFCDFKKCKHFDNGCPQSLTQEVRDGAVEWMGDNAPICIYSEEPECYEEMSDGN